MKTGAWLFLAGSNRKRRCWFVAQKTDEFAQKTLIFSILHGLSACRKYIVLATSEQIFQLAPP